MPTRLLNFKFNTVGGSPTASHFLLLRQKESNPRKGDPGLPPTSWVPCVARLVRRLRNSRFALRQSSPKSPDQPALLGGAQGKKSKNPKSPWKLFIPTNFKLLTCSARTKYAPYFAIAQLHLPVYQHIPSLQFAGNSPPLL